jgi:HAD superfamily hydrolase (TIGR01549 family)
MARVDAVTFDFWQTLLSDRPGEMRRLHVERWKEVLGDSGHDVEHALLDATFEASGDRFFERWRANDGQYTAADATAFISERLGLPSSDELQERLVDIFRLVGEEVDLQVAPGIEQCLAELSAAGVRLGIVCDVGMTAAPTLRRRLEREGLLPYFDAWAFSDETGWFKPAPEAFLPALHALDVEDPSRAAHVGDNRWTDVAGALGLGMVAIRYRALHDAAPESGPEAGHVLDDHRDLPRLLGIG